MWIATKNKTGDSLRHILPMDVVQDWGLLNDLSSLLQIQRFGLQLWGEAKLFYFFFGVGKSFEITQLKLFREQILNLNNGVTSYVNLPEPLCSSNLITLSFKVSNYFQEFFYGLSLVVLGASFKFDLVQVHKRAICCIFRPAFGRNIQQIALLCT